MNTLSPGGIAGPSADLLAQRSAEARGVAPDDGLTVLMDSLGGIRRAGPRRRPRSPRSWVLDPAGLIRALTIAP